MKMKIVALLVFALVLAAPFTAQAADCGAQPSYNSSAYLNWYACKHATCFHSANGIDGAYMSCMGTNYYPVYTSGPLAPFPYGQLVLCDSFAFRNYFGFSLDGYDCYYCLTPALQAEGNPNGLFPGPGRTLCGVGDVVILPEEDLDGDGYSASEDCNDNSYAIHPGATELCDGVDNDCDGTIDDGLPQGAWYRDRDHDGHGSVTSVTQCMAPAGYVANHDDCNDINGIVYPGAPEICDGRDNDCDGDTDEESDADGDGFTACASSYSYQDCNDANPAVFPGMIETTCNGLDDDCNPSTPDNVNCPAEMDGPGWSGSDSFPGDDDAATYPTTPGTPDVDGPGYPGGEVDEDDQDTDVPPVADEPSSPSPDAPDTPVGENPAAPDVPAAGQETNSPEGGSTVGEALPTDATPGDVPPSAESPGGTEIKADFFEAMGGGGCSLIPKPVNVQGTDEDDRIEIDVSGFYREGSSRWTDLEPQAGVDQTDREYEAISGRIKPENDSPIEWLDPTDPDANSNGIVDGAPLADEPRIVLWNPFVRIVVRINGVAVRSFLVSQAPSTIQVHGGGGGDAIVFDPDVSLFTRLELFGEDGDDVIVPEQFPWIDCISDVPYEEMLIDGGPGDDWLQGGCGNDSVNN